MKANERIILILLALTIILWGLPSVIYWVVTGRSGFFIQKFDELVNKV